MSLNKFLMVLSFAIALGLGSMSYINAQTTTTTPTVTPTVVPTSVPAGAPSTGHGPMSR